MTTSTTIRSAKVVFRDEIRQTDVQFSKSQITAIGDDLPEQDSQVIDGTGLYLLPGIVDDQVHFRQPGLEHKEDLFHASRACAKGGITSFLEMPNTIPNTIDQDRLDEKLELASQSSVVNYGFYIGATPNNVEQLAAIRRTPGIKIFIGSSTGNLLVDEQAALERIFAETTLPICAHCEDESTVKANAKKYSGSTDIKTHSKIRNHEAAIIATRRAIDLALRHDHSFHVLHVSTADEIELIREAGPLVTAEVCPHHLLFNVHDYERLGSLVKMNPSIKTPEDNEALFQALIDGDIQVIATDHAPHTLEEKQQTYPDCPSGLPAVENSLALMLNKVNAGRFTISQIVEWMSYQPARIWNLQNKGEIKIGHDADLVLVDLKLNQTVFNRDQ
ncbi:MAG: dihydroorotase, partial [Planctomycetota bacterium]